ncbi:MAG: methyl-accepting chemotaxis protein [Phenylobacterium sp.]|uniref:methyl-accepting chemotaxis protein n=1 Tax=Phenylobacterium sp. TaxID=1871053 RepID=UPI0025E68DEB|nr:HAMP domain-containing methyl-accepting chemotaxis protein [Phenylobacterium sp.]MBI1198332.1 methyl-accepting chemotaxis protein [Phenylobacterium sp.]
MFETIDEQRRFTDRIILWCLWLLAPIVCASAAFTHGAWLALGLAASGAAAGATIVRRLTGEGPVARVTASVALMASISLQVAAFAGHPWQIDMHMAYFACLAMLIGYCDWRAIAAATTVVAVHHLLLSFVLPAAVFPGGGDIGRVLIHAVILLLEAGVLIWAGASINSMFLRSTTALAAASEARDRAEAASREAEAARTGEAAAAEERATLQRASDAEAQAVVAALAEALERLAAGDLSHRITAQVPDRYGQLKRDFNAAAEQLGSTVRTIVAVNAGVRGSIGEIARAAGELSRRTEGQAATLEQTAAALDEITGAVRRTASDAGRARGVVGAARTHAEESGQVVKAAIDAMNAIEGSSKQISQIIGVIDEIAFQTNLLALNAGVEAARAGDAGKGFAVVASEVRALAQRSAEAAKEIKDLIANSAAQVGEGVDLVGRTGEALQRIMSEVGEINGVIAEIANSADQQATGLKEVNSAVGGLDQMTQQNAAMVEEATAAAQSLTGDAERLTQLVAAFQVGAGDGPVAAEGRRKAA